MPFIPITGYLGTVTISGISITGVKNWNATIEVKEEEVGPYIGDSGNIYVLSTNRTLKGTIEADTPAGKDSGHTVLVNAAMSGSTCQIVLTEQSGYTITVPSGVVSNVKFTQDASKAISISFDFRSSGSFTVA